MNDKDEINWLLNDAERYFARSKELFSRQDFQLATHCSQLCIELSAKAVISYYAEPAWTHNPGEQLRKILDEHKEEIIAQYNQKMLEKLYQLADDSEKAAPWHDLSTYGGEDENGIRRSAAELCNEEIAKEMAEIAKRSFNVTNEFTIKLLK